MSKGHKTGGRAAGTPNRKTKEVADLLESLGCNPIEGMAKLAENTENPPELRGRMYAELAQYIYPKRKAVELSGNGGAIAHDHRMIVEFVKPGPGLGREEIP